MLRRRSIKEKLVQSIGFMKWVQLHPDDVKDIGYVGAQNSLVFLSPDVHSLHIIWTIPEDQQAGLDFDTQWEIVDYPYDNDESVRDFLENELFDDAWESFFLKDKGCTSIFELLDSCNGIPQAVVPVKMIAQLEMTV